VRTLEHRACTSIAPYLELDVRLILSRATTHNGAACEDFGRITAFEQITLPPLRERREDIALLAHDFLTRFSAAARAPRKTLRQRPMLLASLRWRGNADSTQGAAHPAGDRGSW